MILSKRFASFIGAGMIVALIGLGNAPAAQAKGSKNPVSGITIVEVSEPGITAGFRGGLGAFQLKTDETGVASRVFRAYHGSTVTVQQATNQHGLAPLQSISCTGSATVAINQMGPNSVSVTIEQQNTVCTFTN